MLFIHAPDPSCAFRKLLCFYADRHKRFYSVCYNSGSREKVEKTPSLEKARRMDHEREDENPLQRALKEKMLSVAVKKCVHIFVHGAVQVLQEAQEESC